MTLLTDNEVTRLDNSNPEFERATPFNKLNAAIDEIEGGVVSAYTLDKSDSAAAFNTDAVLVFTAPYAMRIIDVIVTGCADEASGAVTIYKGTDAIGTEIACAADGVVSHLAAGVVKAHMVLAAGNTVSAMVTAGTAPKDVRGIVTVLCQRL
jgi:hypothetical protein